MRARRVEGERVVVRGAAAHENTGAAAAEEGAERAARSGLRGAASPALARLSLGEREVARGRGARGGHERLDLGRRHRRGELRGHGFDAGERRLGIREPLLGDGRALLQAAGALEHGLDLLARGSRRIEQKLHRHGLARRPVGHRDLRRPARRARRLGHEEGCPRRQIVGLADAQEIPAHRLDPPRHARPSLGDGAGQLLLACRERALAQVAAEPLALGSDRVFVAIRGARVEGVSFLQLAQRDA
ncbi:MAG: hypothetical protein QM820_02525 [Minicystis sp.]